MSSQVTTWQISIIDTTMNATIAASTISPPNIHSRMAATTSTVRMISLRVSDPSSRNCAAAQVGISGLFLMVGGTRKYPITGSASSSGTAKGAAAKNHCLYVISTCAILRMKSSARKFGAQAVMNSELVMQLAAKVTHKI